MSEDTVFVAAISGTVFALDREKGRFLVTTAGPDGEVHILGIVLDLGAAVISSFLPQDFVQHAMEDLTDALYLDTPGGGVGL